MNVASEAGRNVGAISSIESPNSGERKTIKKRATANKRARARTRVEYILCRRAVIPGPRGNCNFLGRITFRTGPGPLLLLLHLLLLSPFPSFEVFRPF